MAKIKFSDIYLTYWFTGMFTTNERSHLAANAFFLSDKFVKETVENGRKKKHLKITYEYVFI